MKREDLKYLIQYLKNTGKGSWARALEELVEQYETEVTLNRQLNDDLAKMHVIYNQLKDVK